MNKADVEAFLSSLHAIPWFKNCGLPAAFDGDVERVEFAFIANQSVDQSDPWNGELSRAESALERIVFDNRLLAEESEVRAKCKIMKFWDGPDCDDFFIGLDEKYAPDGSYFGESHSYPHELFDPPDRLVFGAAMEVMLAQFVESLFFTPMMQYFEAGHCPCGMKEKLLVW